MTKTNKKPTTAWCTVLYSDNNDLQRPLFNVIEWMKEGRKYFHFMTHSTFYFRLYGVRPLSKRKTLLPPLPSVIYTMAFVTSVVGHWLEQKNSLRDQSNNLSHHEGMLYHGVTYRHPLKWWRSCDAMSSPMLPDATLR